MRQCSHAWKSWEKLCDLCLSLASSEVNLDTSNLGDVEAAPSQDPLMFNIIDTFGSIWKYLESLFGSIWTYLDIVFYIVWILVNDVLAVLWKFHYVPWHRSKLWHPGRPCLKAVSACSLLAGGGFYGYLWILWIWNDPIWIQYGSNMDPYWISSTECRGEFLWTPWRWTRSPWICWKMLETCPHLPLDFQRHCVQRDVGPGPRPRLVEKNPKSWHHNGSYKVQHVQIWSILHHDSSCTFLLASCGERWWTHVWISGWCQTMLVCLSSLLAKEVTCPH